jgi:uncharacterized protein (TIGR03663 family)
MKRAIFALVLMGLILVAAGVARLTHLDERPMHADEAVHAVKFGDLLQRGQYRYDPNEYHGPTLNYLSLPLIRSLGIRTIAEVRPSHLRALVALGGVALVALTWCLRRSLGYGAVLLGSALAAGAPSMVFYSRYYIQETLLVLFTFLVIVCLYRARGIQVVAERPDPKRQLRRHAWLLGAGVGVGLMHATKETCIIAWGAMVLAWGVTWAWERLAGWERPSAPSARGALSIAIMIVAAVCVSVGFYSSFGTSASGPGDSVRTYLNYFDRASGYGEAQEHVQAWYYYLRMLVLPGQVGWTEAGIVVLALVGIAAGASGNARALGPVPPAMVRFLTVYTLVLLGVYSAIPYKTPWCVLGILHGLVLLAGIGGASLVRLPSRKLSKVPGLLLVLAIVAHLGVQAWWVSFPEPSTPESPYAYSPTSPDVPRLAGLISDLADASGHGLEMPVQVVFPDADYWPLPWYLRRLTHVDWSDQVPGSGAAPVIITRPGMEAELSAQLYERLPAGLRRIYVRAEGPAVGKPEGRSPELRANVPLHVYVRNDLWERWEHSRLLDTTDPHP